jgi:2-hydroxy-3-oxopropionate reductase
MKGPQIIKGNFQPGFTIDLHHKDLGLIMEAARALQVPLPTTAVVQELFSALRVKGRGAWDHSAVITILEELAGVQVRTGS